MVWMDWTTRVVSIALSSISWTKEAPEISTPAALSEWRRRRLRRTSDVSKTVAAVATGLWPIHVVANFTPGRTAHRGSRGYNIC